MCQPLPQPVPPQIACTNGLRVTLIFAAESVYAGPGAGRYPTANSVVNDIVRLARLGAKGTPAPFPLEKSWELEPDFKACFYVRVTAADVCGVLGAVGMLAAKAGVSVHSVLRDPNERADEVINFVVKTSPCFRSQVLAFVEGVKGQDWTKGEPVLMSIL